MILLKLKVHITLLLKTLSWFLILFKDQAKLIIELSRATHDLFPTLFFLSDLISYYSSPCVLYSRPKNHPYCLLITEHIFLLPEF